MSPEFLAAVKDGQIEGIGYRDDRSDYEVLFGNMGMQWLDFGDQEAYSDHCWDELEFQDRLNGALQRWFTAKGWEWKLNAYALYVWKEKRVKTDEMDLVGEWIFRTDHLHPETFDNGSPLEWHVAAAMHVLACEVPE